MNLNELWSGNDYAWYEYKGRGEIYRPGAKRVKIIRTYKRLADYENERLSGYAEVMMCDDEGNPRMNGAGEHITREVRARDIAMRWDEYASERDHRKAQAEKIAKEAEEREMAENARRSLLTEKLLGIGIPADAISNITYSNVSLNRASLERKFGIATE